MGMVMQTDSVSQSVTLWLEFWGLRDGRSVGKRLAGSANDHHACE
jgi:hypothetical protein